MKYTCFYFALLAAFFITNSVPKVYASHAAGGEMQIVWLHDSTYQVIYKLYRDCDGIQEPSAPYICYYNSCDNFEDSITLSKITGLLPNGSVNGSDIIHSCYPTPCTSSSGVGPGYQEWWYSGIVTLPSRCNHWTFSHVELSRNGAITNIAPSGLYSEATLDNYDAQGDNSPSFIMRPVPTPVCLYSHYSFNNGAYDPDNDSLSFEMIQPLTGDSSCPDTGNLVQAISYINGNTFASPFATANGYYLNPVTGVIEFTSNVNQVAAVTIRVNEYRNGIKIGSVIRDIQFVVANCEGASPIIDSIPVNVSGGTVSPYDSTFLTVLTGDTLNFNVRARSMMLGPGPYNVTFLAGDTSAATGSNFIVFHNGTDADTGSFVWRPAITDTGMHYVLFTATDSFCSSFFAEPLPTIQNTYLMVKILVKRKPIVSNINSTGKQNSIIVYPNPSKGKFTMQLNTEKPIKHFNITASTITGQTIFSKYYNNIDKKITIPIEFVNIPKGLYFIMTDADGEKELRKITVE